MEVLFNVGEIVVFRSQFLNGPFKQRTRKDRDMEVMGVKKNGTVSVRTLGHKTHYPVHASLLKKKDDQDEAGYVNYYSCDTEEHF